jgi:hypothetical protein
MEKQKTETLNTSSEKTQEMDIQALGRTALGTEKPESKRELVEEAIYINRGGQLALPGYHGRTESKEIVVH